MGAAHLAIISMVAAAVFEAIKRRVAEDGLTEREKIGLRMMITATGAVAALSSWGVGLLDADGAAQLGLAIIGAMSARDAAKGVGGAARMVAQKGRSSSESRPPEPPLP